MLVRRDFTVILCGDGGGSQIHSCVLITVGLSRVSKPTLPFLSLPSHGSGIHPSHLSHVHAKNICSIPAPFCFWYNPLLTYHSKPTCTPAPHHLLWQPASLWYISGLCLVCRLSFSRPDRGRWRLAVTVTEALLLRAEGCSPFLCMLCAHVHVWVGACTAWCCVAMCVCDRKLDVLSYVSGSWLGRAGGLARGCWLRCRDGDRCYFGFAAFLQTHELFNNTCPFSSARMARQ